jgi:phosphate-selective porin O/P
VRSDVSRIGRSLVFSLLLMASAASDATGQVTPAAGYTPPDDTPAIKVGATIFADYTIQQKPKTTDADGNEVTSNAFNVSRAYINVTGNLSHIIAFRVTPDIVRETTTGSVLNGSLTFRLKYAYAQFNLDDWMNRGSWVRLGMQQTPWVDFMETVWRYRFQGTIFEDREGFLSSSDLGVSFRYNLPGNYGDIHTGLYNGETYSRSETNDQKGFMIRGTFRPLRQHPLLRGLRATGFYDKDAYVKNAERERAIVAVTFEHPHLNAAFDYLWATDQPRTSVASVDARGFSVWATPRFTRGWEAIVRFDHLEPDTDLEARKNRTIGGVSYWFPLQGTVSTALLFDVEAVNYDDFAPARPDERRFAVHMLVNF